MKTRVYRILSLFLMCTLLGCSHSPTVISPNSNIFTEQLTLEQNWLNTLKNGEYTLDHPFLLHDPYDNSPLSYLLMFNTPQMSTVSYEVVGHTPETSFTYETSELSQTHQLILTGLYPNEVNTVHLKVTTSTGEVLTKTLSIQTESLPDNIIHPKATSQQKYQPTLSNLYLISDDHYHYLIDQAGDIRWIQTASSGSVIPLSDGSLLTYDLPSYYYYHQALIERNYLGQTLKQVYIPGAGHHSLFETESGDYLINSSDKSKERYIEDLIYLLDHHTGEILETINLRDYLDVSRFDDALPEVKGDFNDWFHLNYAMIDSQDDTIIASGRSQSMVVKIDPKTNALKWILGAPDEVNEALHPYLLTPINEPFSWPFAQHSSKVLPDLDQNPDTTDLIVFDNHGDIGVFSRQSYPSLNQYSRAVHYRINEANHTIEQIWSFGEGLNPPLFSTIISEVDFNPQTNSMLVLFGFIQRGTQTGGQFFEVDASDASNILFEMELLNEGVNHIYTIESIETKDLNLSFNFTDSTVSPLYSSHLNLQRTSPDLPKTLKSKQMSSKLFNHISLTDSVLFLDYYQIKNSITDDLSLVLTNTKGEHYTFSISPNDCYLVNTSEKIASFPKAYKQALKGDKLYQIVDRIDLSSLSEDRYELAFWTNDTLYQTNYQLNLESTTR